MNDRETLERGEARVLLANFYRQENKSEWLTKQLQRLTKFYGVGFDSRCRKYMRQITNEESQNGHT